MGKVKLLGESCMAHEGFRQAPEASQEPVEILIVFLIQIPLSSQINCLLDALLHTRQSSCQAFLEIPFRHIRRIFRPAVKQIFNPYAPGPQVIV